MKLTKRIFAGFTSAAIAAAMFALPASAAKKGYQEFEPTAENVKLIGRTTYQNGALWVPWSAGGVEFKATGSSVRFNLLKSQTARLAVYVNGELAAIGNTSPKASNPVVDVPLGEGENVVKLVKLSESANSVLVIDSIEVEKGTTIAPTEAKEHSIEFIGDSITCGYGADGSLKEGFSTKNENAAKTYAYLTAGAFDADYSFVSVSGTGVISGYTNGADKNDTLLAPKYYENLCFTWNWIDGQNPSDLEWDFSEYQPEAVVINLGQNDSSYTKKDEAKCAEFVDGYVDFLKTVRKNNPDAAIECVLGLMGNDLYSQIEEAVAAYTDETGDTNIFVHELSLQDSDDFGYGSDYHPAEGSHILAAGELVDFMKEDLGWEVTELKEQGMANRDKADDAEFVNAPEDEEKEPEENTESESESEAESSEEAQESSSAAESKAAESKAADSSSKAAAASTTSNPSTGAMLALAGVAIAGAAIVTAKKHD